MLDFAVCAAPCAPTILRVAYSLAGMTPGAGAWRTPAGITAVLFVRFSIPSKSGSLGPLASAKGGERDTSPASAPRISGLTDQAEASAGGQTRQRTAARRRAASMRGHAFGGPAAHESQLDSKPIRLTLERCPSAITT